MQPEKIQLLQLPVFPEVEPLVLSEITVLPGILNKMDLGKKSKEKKKRYPLLDTEITLIAALEKVSFTPASFDKRFCLKVLPDCLNDGITERQREVMYSLLHKYRRQIEEYITLCNQLELIPKPLKK